MAKTIAVGAIVAGFVLVLFVAPALTACLAAVGGQFCSDTPTSYALTGIGGLLLLGEAVAFTVVIMQGSAPVKDAVEHDKEQP